MNDIHAESSKSARAYGESTTYAVDAEDSRRNGVGKGKERSNEVSPMIDFTAGVIAGAAGLVVGQPFDVVKVRYQTPYYMGRYGSTFSALGSIMKEEKVKGLFKGVTSPMTSIAFINGVIFTSYSFFLGMQIPEHSKGEPTLGQIFLAGSGSGVAASLLMCPTELIKIRQQSAPAHLNLSTLSVFKGIIRTDGIRGIFRGLTATAMRDVAYGPYFCTYEASLRFFKWLRTPPLKPSHHAPGHEDHNLINEAELELSSGLRWPELMLAGGIAGVLAWIATFPMDVIKTRIQSATGPSAEDGRPRVKQPSIREVAVSAIRKEGWRVMFAGLGPTLIRAVPTNMVIFLAFEGCVSALS